MIDGISAIDTGNNGIMGGLNLPQAAIAEVKLLTSGYQAEYGRSSGLQVSAVTRGGTNRFSGQFYDYERNSDWNANTWQARQNGQPRPVNKARDWGYVIGGPVGKPGGNNKLFFFYTQEFRPRTAGNTVENYRMPTAEERRGDFSQTLDNNGTLYNLIYDASTGQPKTNCSATIQTACFQDGGVVGRIPINRLYGPGIAMLNQYPLPNNPQVAGRNYNYSVTLPVQKLLVVHADDPPRLPGVAEPARDLEVQRHERARRHGLSHERQQRARAAGLHRQHQQVPAVVQHVRHGQLHDQQHDVHRGDLRRQPEPSRHAVDLAVLEQEQRGLPGGSRRADCRTARSARLRRCSRTPASSIPGFYEYEALQQIGTPFFENGRILLPPQLNWGGTRIGSAPPSLNYPGWLNINRIQQFAGSITKVRGSHTFKAGAYFEHSYKAQNTGGNLFQGMLNLSVDTNNPLETHVPVLERRARHLLELRPGLAVHRRQLLLQQLRVVPPGQLEGQPAADDGLRHPVRDDGAVRGHAAAGRELLPRQVERVAGAGALRSRLRRQRESLHRQQPAGQGSAQRARSSAWAASRSSARSSSARATSPTAWCRRATASTRPATPSRGSSADRGSALPTTSAATSSSSCADRPGSTSIGPTATRRSPPSPTRPPRRA